jgi:hypothetical protein
MKTSEIRAVEWVERATLPSRGISLWMTRQGGGERRPYLEP